MINFFNLIFENINDDIDVKLVTDINLNLKNKLKEFFDRFEAEEDAIMSKTYTPGRGATFEEVFNKWKRDGLIYVLYDDSKEIGFCVVLPRRPDIDHISYIYIDPKYRGKGLGKLFLNYIFNNRGRKSFTLNCLIDNTNAFNMYKKIGFKMYSALMFKK